MAKLRPALLSLHRTQQGAFPHPSKLRHRSLDLHHICRRGAACSICVFAVQGCRHCSACKMEAPLLHPLLRQSAARQPPSVRAEQ